MTRSGAPPSVDRPTLVVIADQDEASDLVPAGSVPFWRVPASGSNEQMAWRFGDLVVVVTGSGGPAIAAVTARFLLRPPDDLQFAQVVNFGSCGRYGWSDGTGLERAYFVRFSRQWDLFFNFRGWEYANAPLELATPTAWSGPPVTCFSGGRYSTPHDRHWPMWLTGDIEEYELYSIAWLCAELDVPLAGLKFVTNSPDADATTQKGQHLKAARRAGTDLLHSFLAGDCGEIAAAPVNTQASPP
ncbi:MAG TPA: hypothetical protein VMW33_11385 [Ilumatobacteraceae bacterium]|nr:hypothetical protein [Ilumatobacteraceae bacterium]